MQKKASSAIAAITLIASAAQGSEGALAEELFQQGRALYKAGKIDEACPKFEESQRLAPKLGTLLNLATCHEQQGKTASAWTEFTDAAALARKQRESDRQRYAEEHAEALAKRLAKVVIEPLETPEGLRITLDGRPIARPAWATPLPVDPGAHRIAASAPGRHGWNTTITVEPGPSLLPVKAPRLQPIKTTAPRPEPVEEEEGLDPLAIAGWTVLATGAVALGVGGYFGIRVFTLKDESEAHCDMNLCDQRGVDLIDEAHDAATASTALIAVGVAMAGTGIVLLVLGATNDSTKATARWSW